jgi:hypothetical protein
MNSKFIYISLSLLLINSLCFGSESLYGGNWKHVTHKNGIDIHSKKTKGIAVKSLKAIGVIDCKIDNIVAILRDIGSATEWLPRLIERSYIENISDTEAILYDVNDMPWPVKDRDLVVHHRIVISDDHKSLRLMFRSVESSKKPFNKKRVRARFHIGEIKFTPLSGASTRLELTLLVDPMGKIPKWLVNILQVSMPYDFLTSLNKFASTSKLKPLPGLQKLLDQLIE